MKEATRFVVVKRSTLIFVVLYLVVDKRTQVPQYDSGGPAHRIDATRLYRRFELLGDYEYIIYSTVIAVRQFRLSVDLPEGITQNEAHAVQKNPLISAVSATVSINCDITKHQRVVRACVEIRCIILIVLLFSQQDINSAMVLYWDSRQTRSVHRYTRVYIMSAVNTKRNDRLA